MHLADARCTGGTAYWMQAFPDPLGYHRHMPAIRIETDNAGVWCWPVDEVLAQELLDGETCPCCGWVIPDEGM